MRFSLCAALSAAMLIQALPFTALAQTAQAEPDLPPPSAPQSDAPRSGTLQSDAPQSDTSAMSLAEFDAYVTGKTLTWSQYGQVYGIEEYMEDRRVRWKTAPEECQYGRWYQRGSYICFAYEYSPGEHCWVFTMKDGGLTALAEFAFPGQDIVAIDETAEGLDCPAPDVGA
ncbi:hypothetical protein HOY34_17060 [Xinfangfangia sp. D13-10-4-6]|uniref:hypothetical protein n=1 Tax=Pseudogemmobacter hezensis TaxID=2737662 RepID=UPI001554BFD1|nr:hypothetical protein [Pseudogemmobacter hezensis]NPD16905.1 hypothetical protein [Pseudogemmobacter hezensis]